MTEKTRFHRNTQVESSWALIAFFLAFLLFLFPQKAFSLEEEASYKLVNDFKAAFQKGNPQEIAKFIEFPLVREAPIPSIDTPADFVKRFEEVFDSKLSNMIKNSNTAEDWQEVGWRGIMLNSGVLWLNYEGKVIAVNYQSSAEEKLKHTSLASEKTKLHKSLRAFEKPILDWQTKKTRVRIDAIGNGKYRYAAWPKGKSPATKPSVIISNGKRVADGMSGNHYYEFHNKGRTHRVHVFVVVSPEVDENTAGELEVTRKNGKPISSEPLFLVETP